MRQHILNGVNGGTLSLELVKQHISSVNAVQPYHKVSDSYTFLSTEKIIDALASSAFPMLPVSAREQGTRIAEKEGYTKHVIRFRSPVARMLKVGDTLPEVSIVNAHDRGSSFIIEGGLMRLVCLNGMTCGVGTIGRYSQRHVGGTIDNVLEAVYRVIDEFPLLDTITQNMQRTILTHEKQMELAERALILRFPEVEKRHVKAESLLLVRRTADNGGDLWSVFNRIQENTVRGGIRYAHAVAANPNGETYAERRGYIERGTTRTVKGIDSELQLNRGLWSLANEYVSA